MRIFSTIAAIVLTFAISPVGNAAAQKKKTAQYSVTFEKVVDNCQEDGVTLNKSTVSVAELEQQLSISIPGVPQLTGRVGRRGKLRAKAAANTPSGKAARYGINGRINGQKLQAIFMVEYFAGTKPLCTQSWNMAGTQSAR